MEADLGYDLFMRTTKDIKITEKGIQFYKYATQLVQEYHSTVEKMYDLNITSEPKIKIGILESTHQWVANVIQLHHKMYTNQKYRIYEIHDRSASIDQLLNFDIHFTLTNEKINHEDIISIPLYEEPYVLLTPKNEFPNHKAIKIENLPLIMPIKNSQMQKHLDDFFNRMNILIL